MGLEIQTAKVPGTEIRRTPAGRPAFIGLAILALGVIELVFVILIFWALANNANNAAEVDPAITKDMAAKHLPLPFKNEQTIVSFWIACAFYCLFFMIFLYQRYFVDHITIAKKRFRKWEDEGVQLHE